MAEQEIKGERGGHEGSEGDGSSDGGSENGEISDESSVEESNGSEGNGGGNNGERNAGGDEGEDDRRSNDNEDNKASGDEESDSEELSIENQVPPAQYLNKTSTVSIASSTGSSNDEVLDRDEKPKDEINNRSGKLTRQLSIEQKALTVATTVTEVQKEPDTDTPTTTTNRQPKVPEAESSIDKVLNGDSNVSPHQETLESNRREIVRSWSKKPAPLNVDKRLASAHMRGFIESQFMTCLQGFKESEDIFSRGGVVKHTFFFREDDISGDRTYIALANDYQADDQSIKYVESGEQSISIVLNEIKNDLEKTQDNGSNTQIFIPLQQIAKEHWVLLEIVLRPDNKSASSTDTITAQCYDSKVKVSGSHWNDSWLGSNRPRIDYVNACVKEQFDVDTEWIYEGTQAHLDDHNCGRYTLIKMGTLFRLESASKSIEEINEILAPGGEEQSPDQKQREDNVEAQESLAVSSATSWEELSH